MLIHVLKSKLAHGVITKAELHYEGSISIDEDLLKAADFLLGEKVTVLNVNNGNRFETYTIKGEAGSGEICLNGPAARLGIVGDEVIILSYGMMKQESAKTFKPTIVNLDKNNKIKK